MLFRSLVQQHISRNRTITLEDGDKLTTEAATDCRISILCGRLCPRSKGTQPK